MEDNAMLVEIVYDTIGPIPRGERESIMITSQMLSIIESGKSIMIRKAGNNIVAMLDEARWNFKQR